MFTFFGCALAAPAFACSEASVVQAPPPATAGSGGGGGGATDGGVAGSAAHGGALMWALSAGDDRQQITRALHVDPSGAIHVAGSFGGTLPLGAEPLVAAGPLFEDDAFLVTLSPEGEVLASRRFGAERLQRIRALASHPEGGLVLAGSYEATIDLGGGPLPPADGVDGFVARLDPDGALVWSDRITGWGEVLLHTVAAAPDGRVVAGGEFRHQVNLSNGASFLASMKGDALLLVYDADGTLVEGRALGGSKEDEAIRAVAFDAASNLVVAGTVFDSIDLGGGVLESAGNADVFVGKLDPAGAHLWSRRFGDAAGQFLEWVSIDAPSGRIALGGAGLGVIDLGGGPLGGEGGVDGFVALLDAEGEHLSSRALGGPGDQRVLGVAVDAEGGLAVAGWFQGTLDLGGGPRTAVPDVKKGDLFVARYGPGFELLYELVAGDTNEQLARAVAFTAAGDVVAAGTFEGSFPFAGSVLTSAGFYDLFVARLAP